MSYAFLIATLLLICASSYKLFKDILSPTFVYACAMTIGNICATIGLMFWNNRYELNAKTIGIILLSVLSFGIGELIVKVIIEKNRNKIKSIEISNKKIEIKKWKIAIEIVFMLITLILLFLEIKRIAVLAGYTSGGIGTIIGKARSLSTLYTTELLEKNQNINVIVSQMRKICEILCFINICFLMKNIIEKKYRSANNIGYLIIVVIGIMMSLLTSGRMQILIYFVSAFFIYIYLSSRKSTLKELIKQNYKKIVLSILAIVVLFCALLPLTGRKMETNIISYLSYYFGISIPSLDVYLENDINKPNMFGEETLRGVQTVLYKVHISKYIQPISKEWVKFNTNDGHEYFSNIFTSGKRYFHDFGWFGIIICQVLFSITFSFIYYYFVKIKNSSKVIIFYSSYFYIIIDQIRDELFFADFIHINSIFRLIMIFVLYTLIVDDSLLDKIKEIIKKWKIQEQKNQ